MRYSAEELREASERSGVPFDYLMRLVAAEDQDPHDPEGSSVLVKQLTVIFDHYLAKRITGPDPVAALRRAGFAETADAFGVSK